LQGSEWHFHNIGFVLPMAGRPAIHFIEVLKLSDFCGAVLPTLARRRSGREF
jgi:hypothetical protein